MNEKRREQLTIQAPRDLKERLKIYAVKQSGIEGRLITVSEIVRDVLENFLKDKEN